MRTVHKYVLDGTDNQVDTHKGARFIHVANQGERVTVWADVDTDALPTTARLHVVGTGQAVPPGARHIGTALMVGGAYVFHVYEG